MVLLLKTILLVSSCAMAQRERGAVNRRARKRLQRQEDPVVQEYQGQGSAPQTSQLFTDQSPAQDYQTLLKNTVSYGDQGYSYPEPSYVYSETQTQKEPNYLLTPFNEQRSSNSYTDSELNYRRTIAAINVFDDGQFYEPYKEYEEEIVSVSPQSNNYFGESNLHVSDKTPTIFGVSDGYNADNLKTEPRSMLQSRVTATRDKETQDENSVSPSKRRGTSRSRQRTLLPKKRLRGEAQIKKTVNDVGKYPTNSVSPGELARDTRSGRMESPFNGLGRSRSKSGRESSQEKRFSPLTTPRSRPRTRSRSRSRLRRPQNSEVNSGRVHNEIFTSSSLTTERKKTSFNGGRLRERPQSQRNQRPHTAVQQNSIKTDNTDNRVRFPRKNLFPDLPKAKVSIAQFNDVESDIPSKSFRSRGRYSSRKNTKAGIKPSAPFHRFSSQQNDYQNVEIMSGKQEALETPGVITVTHMVPARTEFTIKEGQNTRTLFADTLETSLQIVDVNDLQSTEINSDKVVFAHIQTNHPQFGVTEYEIEAIQPTRTSSTEESTLRLGGQQTTVVNTVFSTIYNVETLTARTTETPALSPHALASPAPEVHHIGALLQDVLLKILGSGLLSGTGGIRQPTGSPRTQLITHTRSFLTTSTATETLVIPVNFRGSRISKTVTDLKTDVFTITDYSVQTKLNFDQQRSEPFLPLAPTLHRAARVVESQAPNFLNLAYPAQKMTPSVVTRTHTSLTTISTDITSDITVTLGGREIITGIVEPTTKVTTTTSLTTETIMVEQPGSLLSPVLQPSPFLPQPGPSLQQQSPALQKLQLVRALLNLRS